MNKTLSAIAPKCGYDRPEKQQYRSDVWGALLPAWYETKHDDRSHVLIMPSKEGLEIPYLISLGVPEDRIICVDRSAAVIATSIWRKKFPSAKFYASEISEVGKKIERDGFVISCANLDLCCNFSEALLDTVDGFSKGCPIFDCTRIAITVSKGREGSALTRMMRSRFDDFDVFEEPRFSALFACLDMTEKVVWKQGKYMTNRTPMAWVVYSRFYEKDRLLLEHDELIARYMPPQKNGNNGGDLFWALLSEAVTKIELRHGDKWPTDSQAANFLSDKFCAKIYDDAKALYCKRANTAQPFNPYVAYAERTLKIDRIRNHIQYHWPKYPNKI